jgi:tryptophanyl-tRNA synthetase
MRVVSGIQPTGNLHLGNYLGAIRNWVRMQDEVEGQCLYFLADLHAITVYNEPAALAANTREMAAALIASGINPEKSILFNQARVPAHAELAWLLFCTARIGWLNRMTQFKDKAGKNREGMSIGLFAYPVLQAADVLIYQATHVPVGEDQKQHLELARDIATKFPPAAARIMSLRDGSAKMSKSDTSDMSRINLTDDADAIAQKIRKAKTDPEPLPSEAAGLEGRAEARNLVGIMAALEDRRVDAVLGQYGGSQFGPFKAALADLLVTTLEPIRSRFEDLRHSTEIDAILAKGAERASSLAAPTLAKAYSVMGLQK